MRSEPPLYGGHAAQNKRRFGGGRLTDGERLGSGPSGLPGRVLLCRVHTADHLARLDALTDLREQLQADAQVRGNRPVRPYPLPGPCSTSRRHKRR